MNTRKNFIKLFILLTLIIAAALVTRVASTRAGDLSVFFLDVGQGDAIFLQFPDGNQVLIDGGPDARVLNELSDVLSPWDHSIDVVIATHPDADHLAGLVDVLKRYDVEMVVESGLRKETNISQSWQKALEEEGAVQVIIDQPKRISVGSTAVLDFIWPQSSLVGLEKNKPNDYGLVSRLTYGETSFLFPADIERWTESRLLESGAALSADILKVAHHGSKTSTSESFLERVKPQVAVISVGENNKYGHPSSLVLDRLSKNNVSVYRTDVEGRIKISSDGKNFYFQD